MLELLQSSDPRFGGHRAAVAREVGVSRERVRQIVQSAGGAEKLGFPNWREIAVNLLRQNVPLETIAARTGYSVSALRSLRFEMKVRVCKACGAPREPWHHYCGRCGEQRWRESRRKTMQALLARRRLERDKAFASYLGMTLESLRTLEGADE